MTPNAASRYVRIQIQTSHIRDTFYHHLMGHLTIAFGLLVVSLAIGMISQTKGVSFAFFLELPCHVAQALN